MKRLGYKNRFKILIDLLFRYRKIQHALLKYESSIENKMNEGFADKVQMLKYEYMSKGVVLKGNEIPVLEIPIFGRERIGYLNPCEESTCTTEYKDINIIQTGYYHNDLSLDYIKHAASQNIANMLIKEGFLNATFGQDNKITFSINCFGI